MDAKIYDINVSALTNYDKEASTVRMVLASDYDLIYKAFEDNHRMKVLEYMVHKDFDFTITQISSGAGVSRSVVRLMIEDGLLVQTRECNKSKYFRVKGR
ncbi:MAG: hypothetical protein D4S01_08845 [Dehalococcoidia bacterium]|nr:MAG: hypothetical protein D4S01_08845 [Dehalococcoidia bacterium]